MAGFFKKLFGGSSETPTQSSPDNGRHQALLNKTHAARDAFWASVGRVEQDVIAHLINPAFTGGPTWPDVRQAYNVIRTDHSTIVASNGLADVFPEEPFRNGFGSEVYVEVRETKDMSFIDVQNHWTTTALREFAQNVAHAGGINGHLEQYGVASMELYVDDAPDGWKTENGTVGALVGMSAQGRADDIANMPCSPVRTICLTLIPMDELAFIMGPAENRATLAGKLTEAGFGHVTTINRPGMMG